VQELFEMYDIVELNTSVKATYFKYLLVKFPDVKKIIYFDPDIEVFESLDRLLNELETSDIILTPHILTPIRPDDYQPHENLFLQHGIFNLGFIGVNSSKDNVKRFLDWWEARILYQCFKIMEGGFFVDQLPVNLVPIFFKKVKLLESYGYNMAPWNLHERKLVKAANGAYSLQDGSPLYFYHFSSYNYKKPKELCKSSYSRSNFLNRTDLLNIYQTYHKNLLDNRVTFFESIPCSLLRTRSRDIQPITLKYKLSFWIRQFIPPVIGKVRTKILKTKNG